MAVALAIAIAIHSSCTSRPVPPELVAFGEIGLVGEVRGAEAFDMLQAMNTGHDGSMTTVHANTARDALGRLEQMVAMLGGELPVQAVRRQIASGLQIVLQGATGAFGREGRGVSFQLRRGHTLEAVLRLFDRQRFSVVE